MECRGEEGVVFMGVAFRELPGGRSRWRLPQSRDREMQRSTQCGYCVHGAHLLPMDHDRQDVSTPATRCAAGIMPVVSMSNAPPSATPSSVMSLQDGQQQSFAFLTVRIATLAPVMVPNRGTRSPPRRPTTAALPEHDQAIAGMTELIAASERYAGWLKIGKEPDGTPSRTDVEREFAGGRIPIRFTALAPSTGRI